MADAPAHPVMGENPVPPAAGAEAVPLGQAGAGPNPAEIPPNPLGIPVEASKVKTGEVAELRRRFEIPDDIEILVPRPHERFHAPPEGCLGVHVAALEHGFRAPIDPELLAMFNH